MPAPTKRDQIEVLSQKIVDLMLERRKALRYGSEKDWDEITAKIMALEAEIKAISARSAVPQEVPAQEQAA